MDRTIDLNKDFMHFTEFYVFFLICSVALKNHPLEPVYCSITEI